MNQINDNFLRVLRSGDCWEWSEVKKQVKTIALVSADLSGARLADFDLSSVDFSNADFCEADLTGVCLDNACFEGADLSGAKLVELKAKGACFAQVSFDGVTMFGTFSECDFQDSTWSGATVQQSSFVNCKFDGAEFEDESFLANNDFKGCTFEGVEGVSEEFLLELQSRAATLDSALRKLSAPGGMQSSDEDEDEEAKPIPPAENPEIETLLLEDPENVKLYVKYGKWLEERADPRGDLIKVQHALSQDDTPELWEEETELLQLYREHLLGKALASYEGPLKLEWYFGFLRSARIALDDDQWDEGTKLEDLVRLLLENPSAKFLRHLKIGWAPTPDDDDAVDYQKTIDLLVETGLPKTLRALFLGDCWSEAEMSWISIGDTSKLYKVFPDLNRLEILGGTMDLGKIELPQLKRFGVYSGGLNSDNVHSIAHAKWPQLEHLEIWFGSSDFGAQGSVEDIESILKAKGLSKLQVLGLMNSEFTDDICKALLKAPVLRQLKYLDLSMGTMTDNGAEFILSNKKAFSHLETLDVAENFLSNEARAALNGICNEVRSGEQRKPEKVDGKPRYSVVVGE